MHIGGCWILYAVLKVAYFFLREFYEIYLNNILCKVPKSRVYIIRKPPRDAINLTTCAFGLVYSNPLT